MEEEKMATASVGEEDLTPCTSVKYEVTPPPPLSPGGGVTLPQPATPEAAQVTEELAEEEFSWDEYLDETNTEAVPPSAFQHVERSLESSVMVDQLVEVVDPSHASPGYWLAQVVTSCGPLLRLRYLTQSSINVECWREVAQGGLHPVGWCNSHSIPLTVPPDLCVVLEEEEAKQEAMKAVEEAQKNGDSVVSEALDVDGYTAVDRIKCGMKVEVLWELDGVTGWVATVIDNVGGRLLLRYDTPDCSGQTFWLFYQHSRLRPPDWLHLQDYPHRYSHPASNMPYEEVEWAAFLELSRDGARHSSVPCSLLTHTALPHLHNLTAGMFLEAVHPGRPFTIHACKVVENIDSRYIKVSLESNAEELPWTTHINDPLLLPCGYCNELNLTLQPPRDWQGEGKFDWSEYIRESPTSMLSTQDMFPKHDSAEDLGMCAENKLEAVNPYDPGQICVATVKQTAGHLIVVQLDSERDPTLVIHSADSMDLFPTGWCQANNYPLQLPIDYNPRRVQLQPTQPEASQVSDSSDNPAAGAAKSLWCPRLYVNHWCYTGPYLSKSKVAKQSQSVGPGSVELVLREVLSMTINAAYIPTRVLRELERHGPDPSTVCPSWHPTPFKAKFKRYAYTANLPIATLASDVTDFLYTICHTLQCCPNLWSAVPSGENCPLLCTSQMGAQGGQTSGFRGRGRIAVNRSMRGCPGASRILHRRKRGGRKRLFVPVRANRLLPSKNLAPSSEEVLEEAEEEEEAEIEEVEEYDVGSGSDGDTSSRSSRPTSPLLEPGQQAVRRQRKVFPRVDVQAKGMRFSEYNAQMKARHKRKFEGQDGASGNLGCREEGTERRDQIKRGRKSEFPDTSSGLEPANVRSDPLEWTVHDVEQYVAGQPAICHHAVKLRQQEVDGRAFLLLNLPTLVQHLGLPHSSAVALAQHICRVKLAHFLFYKPEP